MSHPPHDPVGTPGVIQLRRWLGFAVIALAMPLAALLIGAIVDPLRQPLVPAPGVIWAAMLCAIGAGLYVGLSWRPDRRGATRGAVLAGALAVGVAVAGAGLSIGAPAEASAIAGCSSVASGRSGQLDGWSAVDGNLRQRVAGAADEGAGVVRLVAQLAGAALEDGGIEVIAGQVGRHCTVLIDGNQALAAFAQLRQLTGAAQANDELAVWRGELEWWPASGGRLAFARLKVGGRPLGEWSSRGLRGEITAEFRPLER